MPGQIVHPLQRERRHDEIERARREGQRFLVSGDAQSAGAQLGERFADHEPADLAVLHQGVGKRSTRRAEIDRKLEPPLHGCQSLGQVRGHPLQEKRFRAGLVGAPSALEQQRPVEKSGRSIHPVIDNFESRRFRR